MRWRWEYPIRVSAASRSCAAAAANFTEGRRAALVAAHSGQGVRTHISDDRVWLSFVTAHYITLNGDRAILDVQLPFLEGPPLPRERHDAFFEPGVSDNTATLFEPLPSGTRGRVVHGRARPAAHRHRRLE
jgi:cellobiose phosphorylase